MRVRLFGHSNKPVSLNKSVRLSDLFWWRGDDLFPQQRLPSSGDLCAEGAASEIFSWVSFLVLFVIEKKGGISHWLFLSFNVRI
jgi:hypothetical protein